MAPSDYVPALKSATMCGSEVSVPSLCVTLLSLASLSRREPSKSSEESVMSIVPGELVEKRYTSCMASCDRQLEAPASVPACGDLGLRLNAGQVAGRPGLKRYCSV